jgi:hypothetical protein
MNLAALMDEVASVMEEITGLRVFAWPPGTLTPPAGYVSYPESIDFDLTYGRGSDKVVGLPICLLSGKATERSARDAVATWAAGDGIASLKARCEAHSWQACDEFTITSVKFDVELVGAIPYLAAIFTADAEGPGGS